MNTADESAHPDPQRTLASFLRGFPWIHLGLGLAGNLAFFVGSLLFFSEST